MLIATITDLAHFKKFVRRIVVIRVKNVMFTVDETRDESRSSLDFTRVDYSVNVLSILSILPIL